MITFLRFGARRQYLARVSVLNAQWRSALPPEACARPRYVVRRAWGRPEPDRPARRARLGELPGLVQEIRAREGGA